MKACFKSILDCKHPLERNMMNNQKRAKILPIFIFTILTILAPALAFADGHGGSALDSGDTA